jgi:cephalosporin-C deacetylase-like acetyl esterase
VFRWSPVLWKQKLYFRPDWEKVITPVVDYALTRNEVDPKRIAIQGISQGGYWVPRAVAFEKRIAAAIADPGVVDVSTSWTASLPKAMLELLKAGRKAEFDGYLSKVLNSETKGDLNFRMRP